VATKKSSTKKQQVQQNRNAVAVGKASNFNIETSLSSLSTTALKVQADFSKISEELIQKHAEYQAVTEAIALKKQEMENLHGVDQVLLTIDEAKAQHAQYLEDQAKERERLAEENLAILTQRNQERQREQESYSYELQQKRKAETDAWNEQVRVRTNAERDRQEAFEKDIANREAALKLKETEYQAAIAKAATFDAEVATAAKREVAIVTNALTKDFNHKTEIAAMQHKTEVDKLQFDNNRLVTAAAADAATIQSLQAQLKAAYDKNAELAAKAVEGASNKQAQADALALVTNIGGSGNGARPRS
jgi:colicin import membrane protein